MQFTQGDQLALGALEDRIAKLSEKLDASDSRLGHLEAIERGLADLLVYLEEMRNGSATRLARAAGRACTRTGRADRGPRPQRPPRLRPSPQSPLDLIRATAAAPRSSHGNAGARADAAARRRVETYAPPPAPTPAPAAPVPMRRCRAARSASRSIRTCRPIRRSNPAAARRASSRARPPRASPRRKRRSAMPGRCSAETGGKSAAIAAARNAVKASYLDTPVKVPKGLGPKSPGWLKWPFKKKTKDAEAEFQVPAAKPVMPPMPAPTPMPVIDDAAADAGRRRGGRAAVGRPEDSQAPEDPADRRQRRHHRDRRGADRDGIPVPRCAARSARRTRQGPVETPGRSRAEIRLAGTADPGAGDDAEPADADTGGHGAAAFRTGPGTDQLDRRKIDLRSVDHHQAAGRHRLDPAEARDDAESPGASRRRPRRYRLAAGRDRPAAPHCRARQRSGRRIRDRRPLRGRPRPHAEHLRSGALARTRRRCRLRPGTVPPRQPQ